ncbi:MAG: threonylcarbamoyl-AMP synthase [Zoogloeaceae bacterium]|nr:threonylcarbamoyl-AMP synthase [Zoogloeaceae bacterium]
MAAEIARAAALLRAGELVAFPTETVYGLGANAADATAVAKIFAAKGRPADHPLIVHLPSAAHLPRWAREAPAEAERLAAAFWPGPLTLILKRQANVPDAVTGGQDTVGLRVPDHPLALALLAVFDGGVAAPSANRFGRISPTTAAHVREEFGDRAPLVLDGGPCPVGIESTILDLSSGAPRLLRPGAISAADIARVLGRTPAIAAPHADAPRASGMLAAHYAPRTPLQQVSSDGLLFALRDALVAGERVAVLAPTAQAISHDLVIWKQAPAEPAGFARALYASLRELDALGCARILVQQPPSSEAWLAINDRLRRAAAGSGADDET